MVPNSAPSGGDEGDNSDHCLACGTRGLARANFCPQCGSVISDRALPAYCMTCGDSFDNGDEFCSSCGAERRSADLAGGQDAEPRESKSRETATRDPGQQNTESPGSEQSARQIDVETQQMFRQRVQEYVSDGWEITEDHGETVVLTNRGIGSMPGHAILLFFTGGIGNLVYGWYSYSLEANTQRLSAHDESSVSTQMADGASGPTVDNEMDQLTAGFASSIMMFVGLVALIGGSPASMAMGLTLITVSIGLIPPVQDRLRRSQSITSFGRQRSVDHRVRDSDDKTDQPCVVCAEEFEDGLIRRRRDETLVFGVPVRTHTEEQNHYCADCAHAEPIEGIPPTSKAGWQVREDTNTDTDVEASASAGADGDVDADVKSHSHAESTGDQAPDQRFSRDSRSQTTTGSTAESRLTESAGDSVTADTAESDRERSKNN